MDAFVDRNFWVYNCSERRSNEMGNSFKLGKICEFYLKALELLAFSISMRSFAFRRNRLKIKSPIILLVRNCKLCMYPLVSIFWTYS